METIKVIFHKESADGKFETYEKEVFARPRTRLISRQVNDIIYAGQKMTMGKDSME
jgi:hypothetical protein